MFAQSTIRTNRSLALAALIRPLLAQRAPIFYFVPTCLCALALDAWMGQGFVPSASGQGQVLFFEDFESGAAGWTYDNSNNGLWHIANDGECLSITKMGAYNNGPTVCNYVTGNTSNGGLMASPMILLSGLPPHTINLNYVRSVGSVGDPSCVDVLIEDGGGTFFVDCLSDNTGMLQAATLTIPSGFQNQDIRLAFGFVANSFDNNHPGFYVDNIEVKDPHLLLSVT